VVKETWKSSKYATSSVNKAGLLVGDRILLTLWVGSLWAIGYIAAPTLFVTLEDRALAGTLAGAMFEIVAYIGLLCAALLLLSNQVRHPGRRLNWRAVVLLVMFLLVLVGQFVVTPMIAEMRVAGSSASSEFARLHGVASIAFLITSLLGLALVVAPDSVAQPGEPRRVRE
jgi:hypothetical protein